MTAEKSVLRQDEIFLRRAFHKSLFPCILSILSQNLNILADGVLVGQRIGTNGLSAISLCVPVYLVLCVVGSFLVSGTAIQARKPLDSQQPEKSRQLYSTGGLVSHGSFSSGDSPGPCPAHSPNRYAVSRSGRSSLWCGTTLLSLWPGLCRRS